MLPAPLFRMRWRATFALFNIELDFHPLFNSELMIERRIIQANVYPKGRILSRNSFLDELSHIRFVELRLIRCSLRG